MAPYDTASIGICDLTREESANLESKVLYALSIVHRKLSEVCILCKTDAHIWPLLILEIS